ncbi:uncharacterized protein LY89DRAFT_738530 [Mollisia scopiformis]|uniref:Secreted protein n=1 Tax=Mollisia scopiformis TaxID=149040 RepID=A0A194WV96_MOLSC|nr:uncharacterized protein LY89DRAFT_738530 [Mollisia scopiformis]KUJ11891.1 hypothetical protein LY89DRAFT_738530 [Mollisia scopiformis]
MKFHLAFLATMLLAHSNLASARVSNAVPESSQERICRRFNYAAMPHVISVCPERAMLRTGITPRKGTSKE